MHRREALAIQTDVADEQQIERLMADTVARGEAPQARSRVFYTNGNYRLQEISIERTAGLKVSMGSPFMQ